MGRSKIGLGWIVFTLMVVSSVVGEVVIWYTGWLDLAGVPVITDPENDFAGMPSNTRRLKMYVIATSLRAYSVFVTFVIVFAGFLYWRMRRRNERDRI